MRVNLFSDRPHILALPLSNHVHALVYANIVRIPRLLRMLVSYQDAWRLLVKVARAPLGDPPHRGLVDGITLLQDARLKVNWGEHYGTFWLWELLLIPCGNALFIDVHVALPSETLQEFAEVHLRTPSSNGRTPPLPGSLKNISCLLLN